MRPGKNKDPEHENKIQKLARRRFLAANQQLVDSDDDGDHDATQAREVTLDGILRRKLYIHKNYGGPRPECHVCAMAVVVAGVHGVVLVRRGAVAADEVLRSTLPARRHVQGHPAEG